MEGVRLAGHGTRPEELSHLTWRDWLRSAAEGLERLQQPGRRVVVVGSSMGALLALQLCATYPSQVARLVTMGSPIYFRDQRIHLVPMVRHVIRWHKVKRPSQNTDPGAHARYFSYRRYPLIAVDHLLALMRNTRKVLPEIHTPALIMQGMRDSVVDPRSANYIYSHLSSPHKEITLWHNSGHGVVFDAEREAVWRKVWEFALGEE